MTSAITASKKASVHVQSGSAIGHSRGVERGFGGVRVEEPADEEVGIDPLD